MKPCCFSNQKLNATRPALGTLHRHAGLRGGSAPTVIFICHSPACSHNSAFQCVETVANPHWVGMFPKSSSTSCDSDLGTCSDLLEWSDRTTVRWSQQDHTDW